MEQLKHLFTKRVLQFVEEADRLKAGRPINFQVMNNPQMLHDSGGAVVHTDDKGQETVFLDPSRATEYMVAHELMHILLHRSHWPQMYSISPPEDTLAENIADSVDNILDHYVFDPRLVSSGFETAKAHNWFIAQLEKWPKHEQSDPGLLLHDALIALEALLYKSFYRRKAIRALKQDHPSTLELAQQLERLVDPQGARNKRAVRQSMIDILKYVDKWLSKQVGYQVNLGERIGISPIFTEGQMLAPASDSVHFIAYQTTLRDAPAYIGALLLKLDQARFRNIIVPGAMPEPSLLTRIREEWQMQSLQAFIESQDIKKYSIDTDDAV